MLKINKILSKKIKSPLSLRGAKRQTNLNPSGFSLIELMVAVVILVIVVFGLFQAFTTAFQTLNDAKDRTMATNYAQQVLEDYKNTHFEKIKAFSAPIEGTKFTQNVSIPPGNENLKKVIVEISWPGRNNISKNVSVSTLIYNTQTIAESGSTMAGISIYATPYNLLPGTDANAVPSVITAEIIDENGDLITDWDESNVDFEIVEAVDLVNTSYNYPFSEIGTLSSTFGTPISQGVANTTFSQYPSAENEGYVKIKASLTIEGTEYYDTLTLKVTNDAVAVVLSSDKVIISTEGGEEGTATLTATIVDAIGNTVESDREIYFNIFSGPGNLTNFIPAVNGVAHIDLIAGTTTGTSTIIATSNLLEPGSINIEIVDSGAPEINVVADPQTIVQGDTATITAYLTYLGNPVSGETINFLTTNWTITPIEATTDGDGKATALLINSSLGEAVVTAKYSDTLSDTVTVKCINMALTIKADPILVLPGVACTVTATLKDDSENPVVGKFINFSSDTGVLSSGSVETDDQGEAQVNITFSEGEVGVNTVDADYLTLPTASVDINCIQYQISVDRKVEEVEEIDVGDHCAITATLTNGGSPVVGKTIIFGTDYGTLTANNAVTLSNGKAEVDLVFSEGDKGKTATVSGTYTNGIPAFEISDTTTVKCKEEIPSDFKVIHGNSIIPSGSNSLTLTNGVDYNLEPGVAAEDCFVRIVNTRLTGIGKTSGGGQQNLRHFTVQISNPENIINSFNFERVGSTNNCRVTWEIIQYIGAEGGANEIKVRTAVGGLSTTAISVDGPSLGNISDINKAVIYITGQSGSNTGTGEWNECLFTAEFKDDSVPHFSRGRDTDTGRVSYAVVEFTGNNWRNIQRVTFNSCGSTVDLDEPLLDVTKTFLHCQYTYVKNGDSGLDDSGETVEVLSTTQLRSRRRTSTDASLKHHVVWIIENIQSGGNYMIVQHIHGTRTDNNQPEEHVWSEAINEVRALDEASIQGETLASKGTGRAYPRGSEGLVITSTTNLNRIQSDTGQDCDYAHSIVQFPTEE